MSFWTAIVVIAAIGAFYSLRRNRALGRGAPWEGELPSLGQGRSAREDELQREIEELRERVRVLERIATEDRGARAIAEEIESLRDK